MGLFWGGLSRFVVLCFCILGNEGQGLGAGGFMGSVELGVMEWGICITFL